MDTTQCQNTRVVVVATTDCLVKYLGRTALSYVLEACSSCKLIVVAAGSLQPDQLQSIESEGRTHEVLFYPEGLRDKLSDSVTLELAEAREVLVIRGDLALVTRQQLRQLKTTFVSFPEDQRFPVLERAQPTPALLQQLGILRCPPPQLAVADAALGLAAGTSDGCARDWPPWICEHVKAMLCKQPCQPPSASQCSSLQASLVAAADPILHAAAEAHMQQQLIQNMQQSGVSFQDPGGTHVHADVGMEPGVQVGVGVQLYGHTHIQQNAVIDGPTYICNANIGSGCHIKSFCHLEDCSIAEGCQIGPYARLRPGASLQEDVFLGNFVEVKNSCMGARSQASHLAYIGDAEVGSRALIAAGCITCNFNGKQKHRTSIGEASFVGSNTVMVAPVDIGHHAMIGAGSTITENVAPYALGIARSRQTVIDEYARRRHEQ